MKEFLLIVYSGEKEISTERFYTYDEAYAEGMNWKKVKIYKLVKLVEVD